MKDFKDLSWNVTEEEYRNDPAYSYSTLAKFERSGFDGLKTLFDKVETPSLTFGSAVDAIITGGRQEFDDRFIVIDSPDLPDTLVKISQSLFRNYGEMYQTIEQIPNENVLSTLIVFDYQNNWKPETRVKVVKEKCADYYKFLFLSGDKTIISTKTYESVLNAVNALKTSEATKELFMEDNPFNEDTKHYYQLKFKATFNNLDYRCMADLIIVDYAHKNIYPIDLKTSSHKEWDFPRSFIDWNYSIQSRLYWRIIKDNMERDEFFKDFKLMPYKFVVVNKETLTPLVWSYPDTDKTGTLTYGKNNQFVLRDPFEIAEELNYYLKRNVNVPLGIAITVPNNIIDKLNEI